MLYASVCTTVWLYSSVIQLDLILKCRVILMFFSVRLFPRRMLVSGQLLRWLRVAVLVSMEWARWESSQECLS